LVANLAVARQRKWAGENSDEQCADYEPCELIIQAKLAKLGALLEEEEKSQDYAETMVSLLEVATQRVAIAKEKYEQAGKVVEDAKRLLEELVENVEQISKKRRTEANADLALLAARKQIAGIPRGEVDPDIQWGEVEDDVEVDPDIQWGEVDPDIEAFEPDSTTASSGTPVADYVRHDLDTWAMEAAAWAEALRARDRDGNSENL